MAQWLSNFIGWTMGNSTQGMSSIDTLLYQLSAILTVFLVIFVLFWLCILLSRIFWGKK